MKLSIKHSPIGKPRTPSGPNLTFGWKTVDFSQQQLIYHACVQGKPLAVAVYKGGHRKSANFISSHVIIIDVDGGANPKGLTEDELATLITCDMVQQWAFAVFESYNSHPGAYRLRVCFELDEVITDPRLYRDLVSVVQKKLPFADPAAKDAARTFYGSRPGTLPLHRRLK